GVVADKELVQRAADNFLAKELRKQSNKEAIAKKTIEILAIEAKPGESPSSEQHPSEKEKSHLDEDWLNIFEQHAETATSERLRTIWSRTLAGEIRKPKSFSLQTPRFISE
ncbi:DUF2806 domain-containing protein, partial [Klebsiella pneumoniae]|nr:DUF2806 domain-containing protein [Klebsiella pneumoniae]